LGSFKRLHFVLQLLDATLKLFDYFKGICLLGCRWKRKPTNKHAHEQDILRFQTNSLSVFSNQCRNALPFFEPMNEKQKPLAA
jgi:hypothetical protein